MDQMSLILRLNLRVDDCSGDMLGTLCIIAKLLRFEMDRTMTAKLNPSVDGCLDAVQGTRYLLFFHKATLV